MRFVYGSVAPRALGPAGAAVAGTGVGTGAAGYCTPYMGVRAIALWFHVGFPYMSCVYCACA